MLFGEKDEKRTFVDFLLKKAENGNSLIYSILNDEYLNFNNDSISLNKSNRNTNELTDLNSIKNEIELGKLIFHKNNDNKLAIREDLLSEIIKLSAIDRPWGKSLFIEKLYYSASY